MGVTTKKWDLNVSHQSDGRPWHIDVIELEGSSPGPSTAFVSGIYGDKPLGSLALLNLVERLSSMDLRGRVTVIPAANPPALAVGTRISPDFLYLNRQFPGKKEGFLTDQIAHHVFSTLVERAECIVDLHSGTATMGLWYSYDCGDLELTSSFGYLPIVVGKQIEGTLMLAAARAGVKAFGAEFGGGENGDPSVGVEGCLNVLRYRGNLAGKATGPKRVAVIDDVQLFLPSVAGVLGCLYGTGDVGQPIDPGVVSWVASIANGERLEEFVVSGERLVLMLANATPLMMSPGGFACMVGSGSREVEVPGS